MVVVRTNASAIGAAIAARLGEQGVARVVLRPSTGGAYGIAFADGADGPWMATLLATLAPLAPPPLGEDCRDGEAGEEGIDNFGAVLRLPDWPEDAPLPGFEVATNSQAMRDLALSALAQVPHRDLELRACHVTDPVVSGPPEVPAPFVEMTAFLLSRSGIRARIIPAEPGREEREAAPRIRVRIPDPALQGCKAPYRVIIRSDRADLASSIASSLEEAGFTAQVGDALGAGEVTDRAIRLKPGPYDHVLFRESLDLIQGAVTRACSGAGIDMGRYPVRTYRCRGDGSYAALIEVPATACLAGKARSTGGDHPDRFRVLVETDDPSHPAIATLASGLVAAGFRAPEIQKVTSAMEGSNRLMDFRVVMGALEGQPKSLAAVIGLLAAAKSRIDTSGRFALSQEAFWDSDNEEVQLRVPVDGVADGRLSEYLARPAAYPVRLIAEDLSVWDSLGAHLDAAGFRVVNWHESPTESFKVCFGAAPDAVIDKLKSILRRSAGSRPAVCRDFSPVDTDIYVHLPARPTPRPKAKVPVATEPRLGIVATRAEPFLSADPAGVQVAGVRLERRSSCAHPALVPDPASFRHFCVDQRSATVLGHLALGVCLGEPCLLEGPTSTAKTSSIQYLASLVGQPVARVNLNGQTDTGELIGRFVPATGARATGGAHWAWQDGVLLEALRHGWWLILDELNLAEPAILERLNSLLERTPSLLVTEHDNQVFGTGGEPIHPEFRIFGTMNPAEYAGRNALSPAYRDRWRGHLIVEPAGEAEYRAMLRGMVFGERPPVCIDGILYGEGASPGSASHGELADQPGIGEFLDALARFQAGLDAGLEAAPGEPSDTPAGANPSPSRREKPVFTRRGLIATLDHLASPAHAGRRLDVGQIRAEAIRRYFLARLTAGEARVARHLLQASGLEIGAMAG